ncbi:MAG: CaiB/BaiF CoA-transferase family protein [Syntrophomonadaceae bacterium]|nr:CaiB/BaiF CoA-transferase family protein [Syntrophomonadaceae bacterium]MDD4549557.1 CaiB/BaiF CoA-transferase family protein [Syntrophomonadaceae bacterium]
MSLPLKGIKILDLSRYLPGPFCTQILADFGAEVIKVEDPRGGDLGRSLPPLINGQSARFYTVNRNKKSITLDLRKPEGKEIFKQLVKDYDIVVDQFRPGVMTKLGVGYEVLQQVNPSLIYCALTGYGLDGPLKDAAGHDLNYLSLSGVTELTGTYQGMPAMSGVQIADIAGGTLYAVIAILLALANRQKTGRGQLCDIAMMDGAISLLAYTLGEWSGWGQLPERGNDVLTGGYACYNIYETADNKFVSLGAVEEKFWEEFCTKMDRKDYIAIQWDKEKQPEVINDIRMLMKQKKRDEWVKFFASSDICFTPVLTLAEMSRHPHVLARDMIYKLQNVRESGQEVVLPGIAVKLSETPGKVVLEFPELGEHNREVLMAAGYTEAEIKNFQENNII